MGRATGAEDAAIGGRRGTPSVPLVIAIEKLARQLMAAKCPFTGVSGDFDNCTSSTREVYEAEAAEIFGMTLSQYHDLQEQTEPAEDEVAALAHHLQGSEALHDVVMYGELDEDEYQRSLPLLAEDVLRWVKSRR